MNALRSLEFGLLVSCVVLAAIAVYQYEAPLPAFHPPRIALTPPSFNADPGFYSPPSEASFSVIDQRPIFNSSRKAVDTAATPGAPAGATGAPPPPPNVTLIGVIADGQNKLALVKVQGSVFATSLSVGTMLDGWQVAEIDPDHVVLRAGTNQATLTMYGARTEAGPLQRPAGTTATGGPTPPLNEFRPENVPGSAMAPGR